MDPEAQTRREGQEALTATIGSTGRSNRFQELLQAGRAFLDRSMEEVGRRSMRSPTVDPDTSYGSLGGLTELHDPASSPARIFFKDRSRPVLVYVGGRQPLAGAGRSDVEAELGAPDAVLACRAGKEYAQWVYPAQGVAVASSPDDLAFVEIFPPLTLEEYLGTLYEDPGPFVR